MVNLIERHRDQIEGVLSCFDRVLIQGTLPSVCHARVMAVHGLQLATNGDSEAHLENIPSESYEFWPYRSDAEVQSIVAAGAMFLTPIEVNVRTGENKIAVKFAARR